MLNIVAVVCAFVQGFEIQPLGVTEQREDDGGRERTREINKDDRVLIVKLGKNQSVSCDLVARKVRRQLSVNGKGSFTI